MPRKQYHLSDRGIFFIMYYIANGPSTAGLDIVEGGVYPKVHASIIKKQFVWEREKSRKDLETELFDLAEKESLSQANLLGVDNIVIQTVEKGMLIDEKIREADLTFLVNPLSGVYNAANQIPFFAFSIAAVSNEGEVISALVKDLSTGCTFHAMKGGGAWFNGETLQVSRRDDHGLAVAFAQPRSKGDLTRYWSLSLEEHPVRFLGSPVLEICFVGLDSLCAYVDISRPPTTSLSELAAAKLILEEAGGIITDTNGKLFTNLFGCERAVNVIATRSNSTHKAILHQVRQFTE